MLCGTTTPAFLIRHSESVKTVQARLGHASAVETLDTYSHLWLDSHDRTREAIDSVARESWGLCAFWHRPLSANWQVSGLVRMGWLIGREGSPPSRASTGVAGHSADLRKRVSGRWPTMVGIENLGHSMATVNRCR